MNTNMQILNQVVTMSSREIAELCEKQHKNVMADIRNMLNSLGIAAAEFSATAIVDGPNNSKREIEIFNLPKRETLILVSGYNIHMRAKIIDRWQELEANPQMQLQPLALTLYEVAGKQFKTEYEIWTLLDCPLHIAQQEIVKRVRNDTGVDFSAVLKHAPAQQNILQHEIMLEPSELGERLQIGSGRQMNRVLEALGLQRKVNGVWVSTDRGEVLSQSHAWTSGNKSGYNLKWNFEKVRDLLVDNDMGD